MLTSCSTSRLSEEIFKILQSGYSASIMKKAAEYGLLHYLLPEIEAKFHGAGGKDFYGIFFKSLSDLDERVKEKGENRRSIMIRRLVQPSLDYMNIFERPGISYSDVVRASKEVILPMIAPNRNVEDAVKFAYKDRNMDIPHSTGYRKSKWNRGKGSPDRHKKNGDVI